MSLLSHPIVRVFVTGTVAPPVVALWVGLGLLALLPLPSAANVPADPRIENLSQADLEAIDAVIRTILDDIDANRLERAEVNLRALLERQDAPPLRDLLGVVLSRQERFPEAEKELKLAIAGAPELKAPREHLGRLYLLSNRHEEALLQLRAAARLGELDRELALALASAELRTGDPLAGEAQLRSVAERFDSVFALLEWARSANGRGDLETTLRVLGRAVELAPNSEAVLGAFARAHLRAGLPVPAIQALEPLHRMHPTVAEYPYLLGVALLQVGDLSDAIEVLRTSMELDDQRALTWIALGLVLNRQKRYPEAVEHLERGLLLAPESPEALAAMAEAREGLGQLEVAQELASKVIERNVGRSTATLTAHLVLGLVAMKQGRYEDARSSFEKVLEGDPDSSKAHYQLSLAYARLGNSEKSEHHLALYQEAQEASETNLEALRQALQLPEGEDPSP